MTTTVTNPSAAPWAAEDLATRGFKGFRTAAELRGGALRDIPPEAGGVYIVQRAPSRPPAFLRHNPAGRFRGDPTVTQGALRENWVADASVLYIGKANHGRLRARVRELVGFGAGGTARHWGGRLLWQLADSADLRIAWSLVAPGTDPRGVEVALLRDFQAEFGALPFANLAS